MNLFLIADPKCYSITNTQKDYVSGLDKYPKTLSKAYNLLVNYALSNKLSTVDVQHTMLSFYQDDDQCHNTSHNPGLGNGLEGRDNGYGQNHNNNCSQDQQNHGNLPDVGSP